MSFVKKNLYTIYDKFVHKIFGSLFQDGVMALSVTHRYREKYVSTLLYKPINVE